MDKTILVCDVGTQSLRCSIYDSNGETLIALKKKYEPAFFSPQDGFCEQDPNYYLNEIASCTNEFNQKNPELLGNISGMVITCFRDSSVILDENYMPIRPAILWLDQRVCRNPKLKGFKLIHKLAFKLIGMTDAIKFNYERSTPHWIEKNEPENWKKMKYFAPLPSYFNYKITGNFVISNADCIGHFPLNCKKGKYFPKGHFKYTLFGMPYESLPELVNVGDVIGEVSEEFSKLSNIPAGTKVYASGSDKACETFGNGCVNKVEGSISLGTACSIDVVDNVYKEPEAFLPSYPTPYRDCWAQEIQIYRGLWMINWFAENFGTIDIQNAKQKGISLEEYLTDEIAKIHPGSDGLVLQPYWGPGLLRPNAKGSIVGFSAVHGRFHLYRAMIEGIGFALRDGLEEIMKKTHIKPTYFVISGGGSQSELFCQIMADILDSTCYQAATTESSSLGAAMSGFMSMGVFSNKYDALKSMYKKGKEIKPNKDNVKVYDKLYNQVYKQLYPSLKKIYFKSKNFYLDFVESKK